jgi:hypothetical protein
MPAIISALLGDPQALAQSDKRERASLPTVIDSLKNRAVLLRPVLFF